MKICFVRLSALGDIIMMLPFVRTLQKQFPEAKLTWVITKSFYPIVEHLEGVEFILVDKIRSWRDFLRARNAFKGKSYDVLLCMQASLSANLLYPLIRAKRKIGFDRGRSKDLHSLFIHEAIAPNREHILESFLAFAKHLGATELSDNGEIPLLPEEKTWVQERFGDSPYYVIHPCSSNKQRDWPTSRYIEVASHLQERHGLRLVLTGGPRDTPTCRALEEGLTFPATNLCGQTPLRHLAAVMQKAKFVIAPDTGPSHLASSFRTPVFGLYAISPSELSGPYFSKPYVIDKSLETLQKFGTHSDRAKEWNVRVYHDEAMELITTAEVTAKIEAFLSGEFAHV